MNLKKTKFSVVLNILCLIQLFGMILFLVVFWAHIPQQVPMHYDLSGNITRWGSKKELMLEFPSWFLFAAIALLCGDIGYWMYRLWKCR